MPGIGFQRTITGGIGADGPFWESLARDEFRLCRCAGCGRWQWPAHHRCAGCGSWEHDWPLVEPVGSIYSWTRSHMAFPRTQARAEQVPYVVALVTVDGTDGARVFGVLRDDADPRIGTRVRGVIEPPSAATLGYPSVTWQRLDRDGA